ncbi:MAG TPA: hypothetical protein VHO24_19905 [Opitutaceae bacterium]|nr:hypothetical protein [Opitutaceae bacterium]
MIRRSTTPFLSCLALALPGAFAASPASAPTAANQEPAEAVFQLPPLIVAETRTTAGRPWFYVAGPGFEVLSRSSEDSTADFARDYHRATQLLELLVPAELQVKLSSPSILFLYRKDMVAQIPAEIVAAMSGSRALVLPNMALHDVDLEAVYTLIGEYSYARDNMRIATEAVWRRMETRTPPVPAWFIEGIMQLYPSARFLADSVELPPLFWINKTETEALRQNRNHPRSLLALSELFKGRSQDDRLAPNTAAYPWKHQAALFIHWALDYKKRDRRTALYKFVRRASEAPVTEAMFEECFGLGFADVQERLSDYLPRAVDRPVPVWPDEKISRPKPRVRIASPTEVARIKGEMERLFANHVRTRYPSLTPKYQEQARLTLLRAYDQGDRDPNLLAAIGLSYCDAGEGKSARPFLDQAAEGGTLRTRAYFELAALHYREGLPPEGGKFTAAQTEEILQPLRTARNLLPPLAGAYDLLARTLWRTERTPTSDELAWLAEGVTLFPRNSPLIYRIAQLHVLHGSKSAANALIKHGLEISRDDAGRSQFEKLNAALALRPH